MSPVSPVSPVTAATPSPDAAVRVQGLTKIYGGRTRHGAPALDRVDLAIPRGSMFALLGPNGAGKSTLINILAGLVRKTAGSVQIWGFDIDRDARSARAAIGVVPQELNIDSFFTAREYLEMQAGFYGVPRAERRTAKILETVGLTDKADVYSRTLSGGMRRRLLIAKAMVHNPPVLVLDEPTAGVDIDLREQLWENVKSLNRQGVTILLTTHYLDEAETLCDRIAIIDRGKLVACEARDDLLRRIDSKALCVTVAEPLTAVPDPLRRYQSALDDPHHLTIRYRTGRVEAGELLDALRRSGVRVIDLTTREADLATVFRQLTGGRRKPEAEEYR